MTPSKTSSVSWTKEGSGSVCDRATDRHHEQQVRESAFLGYVVVCSESLRTNLRKERQMEGIAKAKERGVYKGRKPSVDVARVKALIREWIGVRLRLRRKVRG